MKILVSGASGLVGARLCRQLIAQGDQVIAIPRSFFADPSPSLLEGCDVVIHLAGAGISDRRWSAAYKNLIRTSRIQGTTAVANAIARCTQKPKILICASAIGIYGNRGDEELAEGCMPGTGFLAEVVRDWEVACEPVRDAGVRVVNVRFGMILSLDGGALAKMLPLFRIGLGGPLGSGKQWISWVALQDVIGAIQFAIAHEELQGPVNVVAPGPIRNVDFANALGSVLHRPAFLSAPGFALRLVMGSMADELLLSSQRVVPQRLLSCGFRFQYPDLRVFLRDGLA